MTISMDRRYREGTKNWQKQHIAIMRREVNRMRTAAFDHGEVIEEALAQGRPPPPKEPFRIRRRNSNCLFAANLEAEQDRSEATLWRKIKDSFRQNEILEEEQAARDERARAWQEQQEAAAAEFVAQEIAEKQRIRDKKIEKRARLKAKQQGYLPPMHPGMAAYGGYPPFMPPHPHMQAHPGYYPPGPPQPYGQMWPHPFPGQPMWHPEQAWRASEAPQATANPADVAAKEKAAKGKKINLDLPLLQHASRATLMSSARASR